MNTTALSKKKKLIELPEDTFKRLSVMAIAEGKSLKAFIENLLISESKAIDDEALYRNLIQSDPEGKQYLNGKEKDDFEQLLGV